MVSNTGFRNLEEGQWFYAQHFDGEENNTLCRVNHRRTKDEYEIEAVSIVQPWQIDNHDRQTKMICKKANIYWTGNGGELWWTMYYPGCRFICHPGSKVRIQIAQICLISPKEAQAWETARKSSKWYFKTAHFFGCFAGQKMSAKTFIQAQTLPCPDQITVSKVEAKDECFNV